MATLDKIVDYLNERLKVSDTPDYGGAYNGLQLENCGEVSKVVSAVDASEAVIKKAVDAGADLLIVHHGLFWHGVQHISGAYYRKLKLAMDNNLAIYSAHLPLDVHPELGNNILLSKAIGLKDTATYGDWEGIPLGVTGHCDMNLSQLIVEVERAVKGKVHVCAGYGEELGKVGVVTGGAGSEVAKMKELGIDTFITGEGPHWSYSLAEELAVNVIYAGHYATEVFGVKEVAAEVAKEFLSLASLFVDHPTGL